jgi:nondiscriminating glutamyl-tRNA synthetase
MNVLLARKTGGKAVLRIEDTDQERYVSGAEEQMLTDLEWAGLRFDESPWAGGDFGPYRQSERLSIYLKYVQQLLGSGHAYRCFCTHNELEKIREEEAAQGKIPKYDGRCRHLTSEQVQEKMTAGVPHVIRQKIPDNCTVGFHDLIRGDIQFESDMLDDQILLKSDGFPTYHLAHVVDDHLMEITHILRGEEWITSAPKHLLLFEALGWEPPYFAHLPLILDSERKKLSKRAGNMAAFVKEFRNNGFLPEALVNYLALLGWHPEDDREIFTFDELAKHFDLKRVSKAGAVFDPEKLEHINSVHLRQLTPEDLAQRSADYSGDSFWQGISKQKKTDLIAIVQSKANTLSDLPDLIAPIIKEPNPDGEAREILKQEGTDNLLTLIADSWLNAATFGETEFKDGIKQAGEQLSRKGRDLWMPVRVALTAQTHGPELNQIALFLGKDTCVKRLKSAAQISKNESD